MVLAVDAGGTSTRAVLVEMSGRCVGFGVAGGGNPVSWGPEAAAEAIGVAADRALTRFRADVPEGGVALAGTVLAMAGGNSVRPDGPVAARLAERLGERGLVGPVRVASDLLATFCSGTPAADGYALVAGTGAAVVRVRWMDVDRAVDGLGWLLGDVGSGFWIGRRVARAALAALDGRGPRTRLAGLLADELGIALGQDAPVGGRPPEIQQIIDALYGLRPVELSRFAGLALAADDDAVAAQIRREAVDGLLATLVAARLGGLDGPVALGGGIALRLPGLAERIEADMPGADVIPVGDGTVGAAVLALRGAGVTVGPEVFNRIGSSLAGLRRPG